ncbi:hypothetical protein D3C77_523450 [compost metagenome]
MLRMPEADQDVQAVLAHRLAEELHAVAHVRAFTLQVVARHVFVLQGQAHPPGSQHAHRHRKVAHRHLLQTPVIVEFGRIGIVAHHRDGVRVEIAQGIETQHVALALEQPHVVAQVALGEGPDAGTRIALPGVDQHIVAALADAQQRACPRRLLELAGKPGTLQGGGDKGGGQPAPG